MQGMGLQKGIVVSLLLVINDDFYVSADGILLLSFYGC